ncbi:MAG: methionine synthase [Polaromonas sp.]|nr:methionine synthase [Polaromonas sp.]
MAPPLSSTSIAGSLPKPGRLSETNKLWPQWKAEGAELAQAKADATLLWIKAQEDAGLDVMGDGEQSRQHFVHGFLEQVEGIDFGHKVKMGIRDNRYDAMVPQVVSALRLRGRVHAAEAQPPRAHTTRKIKFDEPAFNVYMKDAAQWGVQTLERAAQGLTCTTAVHICYGYGIQANNDWKSPLGQEWRQYEAVFPALAKSAIQQVSLECYQSHVSPHLTALLEGKDVMVGVIDVASSEIETPEQVADTIGQALQYVPKNRLLACTNCGLAPMDRDVAVKKLQALVQGAALARQRYGATVPEAAP